MGNLVKDIEVFDELLKAGVETKKYVGYKSWGQVLNTLAKESGKRLVQLPNGQVVELLSGVGETSAGATTGLSTYGMAAVNVAETDILAGDAVITASGEVITLGETTTGLVVSGTSDVAAAGALGTTTACESGFLLTPKAVVVAGVAAVCGFAIGDAIAGKIASELDGEDFDWGSDTVLGRLVNKAHDQILMRVELGGKTSFDADLIDRVYNALVQKGFFFEGDYPFTPDALESGKTYHFTNLVSVKELAKEQVKLIKKAVDVDSFLRQQKAGDYPDLSRTDGFNEALFNKLDELVNGFDETGLNGVGSVCFNIRLGIGTTFGTYGTVYLSCHLRRTDRTVGRYSEETNTNYPDHPDKFMFFDGEQTLKRNKRSIAGDTNETTYAYITGYSDEIYVRHVVINDTGILTETEKNNYIPGMYQNISNQEDDKGLWRYLYASESWNIGRFQKEQYKKRKLPNAKTPDVTKSLAENYPKWYNDTKEQSTPTEKNKNKKKKYRKIGWVLNNKTDPENKNLNDQDKAQSGDNDNDNLRDKWPTQEDIIINIIQPPTDPSDPDPEPEGENPEPFVPANPVSESGFVSLYTPSLSELKAFSSWLWSTDFSNSIKKLFQDPMNAIIGLHMLYTEPEIGERKNIIVGYVDSNVNTRTVANQYKKIDCGTIAVREYYGDSRDYDFTNISIYLPFLGIQQLNAKDLMGGSINVTATVDVLTGTILYNLNVTKNGVKQTLYTFSGNCAVQLPISSGSYASILANTIGLVAGGVATFATGGGAAPLLIGAAAQAATGTHAKVSASNTIGSNAGAMGIKKPYLILNRQNSYNASYYNDIQGYPSNVNVKLANCSGFTKIKECHLDGIPATDEEIEEIYTLLKQGVIL